MNLFRSFLLLVWAVVRTTMVRFDRVIVWSLVWLTGMIIMAWGMPMHANAAVTNIGNAELAALLKQGVAIVDIRTEPEWRQTGVIAGSHLLTLFDEKRNVVDPDGWLRKVRGLVPQDQPIILICRVGNRTVPATRFLVKSGYRTVYNVTGGIVPWIAGGMPIEAYRWH